MRYKKLRIVYLIFVLLAIVVYFLRPQLDAHTLLKGGPKTVFFSITYVCAVLFEFVLSYFHFDLVFIYLPLFLISIKRITDNNEVSLLYLSAFIIFSGSIIFNSVHYFHRFIDHYDAAHATTVNASNKLSYTEELKIIDGPHATMHNYTKFIAGLPIAYYGADKEERKAKPIFTQMEKQYSPATELKAVICFFTYAFLFFIMLYCIYNYKYMKVSWRI